MSDFQIGDRVSVEGVVTQALDTGAFVKIDYPQPIHHFFPADCLTLVERPVRKLRIGSAELSEHERLAQALDAALDEIRTLHEQIEAQGETLAATIREANDAIEDAQDEIEKLISEKEALRAERDDIQRRFDLTWAYAKPRVTVMTSVPNPASSPGGAS